MRFAAVVVSALAAPALFVSAVSAAADGIPIAYGERVESVIPDDADALFYRFTGEEGDVVRIALGSEAFDAYLDLKRNPAGGNVMSNDDRAEGETDAMIETALPASGVYFIRVGSYGDEGHGAYTLSLTRQ